MGADNSKKILVLFIFVFFIMVVIFLFQKDNGYYVIESRSTDIPGKGCKISINKATLEYIGEITEYCSAVNCENKTTSVKGNLTENEYNEIVRRYNSNDNYVCSFFE